jgi:hypothetical protein
MMSEAQPVSQDVRLAILGIDQRHEREVGHIFNGLVAGFAWAIDNNRPDAFSNLVTEDFVLIRHGKLTSEGHTALVDFMNARRGQLVLRHLVGPTVLVELGDDEGVGVTTVLSYARSSAMTPGEAAAVRPICGAYEDSFRKTDGVWRMARRSTQIDFGEAL